METSVYLDGKKIETGYEIEIPVPGRFAWLKLSAIDDNSYPYQEAIAVTGNISYDESNDIRCLNLITIQSGT